MSAPRFIGHRVVLSAVVVFWWAVNVPCAAAGLIALGTAWPISWLAAIVLPTSGIPCARLLHRIDASGGRTAGSRLITVLLLFVMAVGFAGVSYPVGNPGRLSWYMTGFFAAVDVLVAYQFPRVIIALAHTRPDRGQDTAAA
ncbi:hypothetical protein ACFXPX_26955 [Kitasatospora sp. NPDC059146]|uniref:hypothetical protein n=1 Tax=Kitasatospora sp. NPDC059146 TaxID=3346741 RepID=UPI0036A77A21